jgi:hypothetical protein
MHTPYGPWPWIAVVMWVVLIVTGLWAAHYGY